MEHTTHAMDVGRADIDNEDPCAITERIRFLVKHEHPFADRQMLLESVLHRGQGYQQDRQVYEDFLQLVKRYRAALEAGTSLAVDLKKEVQDFDRHLG